MTELTITKAGSVQFPVVRRAAGIGWTPLTLQAAMHKRGGEARMLFRDEFGGKLDTFNSWMSAAALRQVIDGLTATLRKGVRRRRCRLSR